MTTKQRKTPTANEESKKLIRKFGMWVNKRQNISAQQLSKETGLSWTACQHALSLHKGGTGYITDSTFVALDDWIARQIEAEKLEMAQAELRACEMRKAAELSETQRQQVNELVAQALAAQQPEPAPISALVDPQVEQLEAEIAQLKRENAELRALLVAYRSGELA